MYNGECYWYEYRIITMQYWRDCKLTHVIEIFFRIFRGWMVNEGKIIQMRRRGMNKLDYNALAYLAQSCVYIKFYLRKILISRDR